MLFYMSIGFNVHFLRVLLPASACVPSICTSLFALAITLLFVMYTLFLCEHGFNFACAYSAYLSQII